MIEINNDSYKEGEYNENLFWKLYHNQYIRNVIFYHLKTMDIQYSNLVCYYLGNRIQLKFINYLNWYLNNDNSKRKRILLIDRLLNENQKSYNNYNNHPLIIQNDDILKLIKINNPDNSKNDNDEINLSILKLLYSKYQDQMNQVDLISECLNQKNKNAFKLFTEYFQDLPISNELMNIAISNNFVDFDYLFNNRYNFNNISIENISSLLTSYNDEEKFKITRYLMENSLKINGSTQIIEFSIFKTYNDEFQKEMLKKNLIIKLDLSKECASIRFNEINENIMTFVESYYSRKKILKEFKFREYYILKIIGEEFNNNNNQQQQQQQQQQENESAGILLNLISNLNKFGISNQQFLDSLSFNTDILNNFTKLLSINFPKNLKEFLNKFIISGSLLVNIIRNNNNNTLVSINEKIEIFDILIDHGFKQQVIEILYPFKGLTNFQQAKQLYEKLIKINDGFSNYLIFKSYYVENIIVNCEIEPLKELIEMVNNNKNKFKFIFQDNLDQTMVINNFFKNTIGEDEILQYIECFQKLNGSLKKDNIIKHLFIDFDLLYKIIDNFKCDKSILKLLSLFKKFINSNDMFQLLLDKLVNQENIQILDTILNYSDTIEYTLTSTNPIIIKWAIDNSKRFKKLEFSNLLEKLINNSRVKNENGIIHQHVEPSIFEAVLNYGKLNGNNSFKFYLIGAIKGYYDENIENNEIVNNCKLILKMVIKNHSLFYWNSFYFKNNQIPTFIDDGDDHHDDSIILEILNQAIPKEQLTYGPLTLALVNKKKPVIIPKKNKTKTKNNIIIETITSSQIVPFIKAPESKPEPIKFKFNNLEFKNCLSLLVVYGQVRQAIAWLKNDPMILPINQVEEIVKYYDLELIQEYFEIVSKCDFQGLSRNDIYRLLCCIQNNRFDVFEFLIDHLQISISKKEYESLILHCASSFNTTAVIYLLNHHLFNEFSNSKEIESKLHFISVSSSNIILFNYLLEKSEFVFTISDGILSSSYKSDGSSLNIHTNHYLNCSNSFLRNLYLKKKINKI